MMTTEFDCRQLTYLASRFLVSMTTRDTTQLMKWNLMNLGSLTTKLPLTGEH